MNFKLTSTSDLKSIGWLSSAMKFKLKNIVHKSNGNLFIERHIRTETPKLKNRTNDEKQRHLTDRRRVHTNYDKLGVSLRATQKEIKTAYYSMSKKLHPDVNNTSEAAVKFREITDAYEVLSNKESKHLYDSSIGNHLSQNKSKNSAEINQKNLNNYREYRPNFSDNEDFLTQKLKKRRTIRIENTYKTDTEERHRYEDPLKYESAGEYFKNAFNEDMQRRYAEQIEKRSKDLEEQHEQMFTEAKIKLTIIAFILTVPLMLFMLDHTFDLSKPTKHANKSDNSSNSKT